MRHYGPNMMALKLGMVLIKEQITGQGKIKTDACSRME